MEGKQNIAIERGLAYIFTRQLASGEFPSYIARDSNCKDLHIDGTIFPTVLLGISLKEVKRNFPARQSQSMDCCLENIENYLLANQWYPNVWHYWNKSSLYFNFQPPDIDDTVCASIFLEDSYPAVKENAYLFYFLGRRKGLYNTWMVPRLRNFFSYHGCIYNWRFRINPIKALKYFTSTPASYNDADNVIQANILHYLGDCDHSKSLKTYIEQFITLDSEYRDKCYHRELFFLYAISRSLSNGVIFNDNFHKKLAYRINTFWDEEKGFYGQDILDNALAIIALSNINSAVQPKSIEKIYNAQFANGGWGNFTIYFGGYQGRKKHDYWGWSCDSLTSMYCIEALLKSEKSE